MTARSSPALRLAAASAVDLAGAIDAFLSQPDLARTTRAKYRQTLAVVEDELGDAPVSRGLPPRLIAGRRAGPVFLSSLRSSPARAPAAGDICPVTGTT